MQQQPKDTTPKYLSAIDFLLNQVLLPAISPSQEISWNELGEKFRKRHPKFRKQLFLTKLQNGWREEKKFF